VIGLVFCLRGGTEFDAIDIKNPATNSVVAPTIGFVAVVAEAEASTFRLLLRREAFCLVGATPNLGAGSAGGAGRGAGAGSSARVAGLTDACCSLLSSINST
jgi:hypothetical protein